MFTAKPTDRPQTLTGAPSVADAFAPLLDLELGRPLPVRFEFWDGTGLGPTAAPGVVRFRSADAIRRIVWSPGELGLGRAFVTGDLDIEGDLCTVLRALQVAAPRHAWLRWGTIVGIIRAARLFGVLKGPLPAPPEESTPRGRRHSQHRDAEVVGHHYDVGNDFYRLVLGPSLTYSCARYPMGPESLEAAQAAKHDLICRKLGLAQRQGMRLLDVGCGWGSMAIHAASVYGATVVGITISRSQAELARRRVADLDLSGKIDIRVQDYRELSGETFDAISSIGMFEHVGKRRLATYFDTLRRLLPDHGRLLNHGISSVGGSPVGRGSFIGRYVFPDGELIDVGDVVLAMERSGFEVRDVESLREHYARTLRAWVSNLDANWDAAVGLVGETRARVWRLYMSGSVVGFEDGGIGLHQVLGVVPDAEGHAALPLTRREWT